MSGSAASWAAYPLGGPASDGLPARTAAAWRWRAPLAGLRGARAARPLAPPPRTQGRKVGRGGSRDYGRKRVIPGTKGPGGAGRRAGWAGCDASSGRPATPATSVTGRPVASSWRDSSTPAPCLAPRRSVNHNEHR